MTIFDLYAPLMRRFRRRRHEWFLRELKPDPADRMLDVGGYPAFWTSQPPAVGRICCLNIGPVDWNPERAPQHHIEMITGDGCALGFPDASFDILFSNSVIEHVGSWERQQAFAREARRTGRSLWVQTPAFECPVEPHYYAPFVHWLPRRIQKAILRWFTPWGLLQKPTPAQVSEAVETTRLLTRKEMKQLFPDCEILTERLLGIFPKSYIAVRKHRDRS